MKKKKNVKFEETVKKEVTEKSEMDFKIDEAMAKIIEETVGNNIPVDAAKSNTMNKQVQTPIQKVKKKKGKAGKIIAVLLGMVIVAVAIAYGSMGYYYKDKFFEGTTINHIEASKLTVNEVEEQIRTQVENYKISVNFREDKAQDIMGSAIGYKYVSKGDVEKIMEKQNPLKWITGYFEKKEYETSKNITFDEGKLKEQLQSLDCMKTENQVAPTDAYVVFKDTEFVIIEEVEGTTVNTDMLYEAVKAGVASSAEAVSAEEVKAYQAPTVKKDNADLVTERDTLNLYAKASITYTFGEKTEVLNGMTIKDWLSYDEMGKVIQDEAAFKEKAKEYVAALANKYDTMGKDRTFHSTAAGANIQVSGGSYGWKINRKKETAQLVDEIMAGTVTTREPIYSNVALTREGNEIGSTYVEVDLGNQHLWFYKNGSLVVESDFVSGRMTFQDRVTPSGVYSLYYKEANRTLRGKKKPDGTYEYESKVKYWMPFNGGVGLHDASWRSSFGGDIYKTGGSHGCVNLPTSAAETIFNNISAGVPIVCFY